MLEIKDVPYRAWNRYGELVETKEGKRVMALMFKEMKAGKAVELFQSQPLTRVPPVGSGTGPVNQTYDTISLTITD